MKNLKSGWDLFLTQRARFNMPRKTPAKKARAQARAARKRAKRNRPSHSKNRRPTAQSTPVTEMNADLVRLVEESPVSKREISEEEETAFLDRVIDINAKAVARDTGSKQEHARLAIEALIHAGTLELREDLHLVPIAPPPTINITGQRA